jgi:hypothetical protein
VILGLGVPADAAERLATMGIALLAGSQQMDPGVGTDELLSVFDEFERSVVAYTDQPARAGLLSRRAGPDRRPPAARTRPRP